MPWPELAVTAAEFGCLQDSPAQLDTNGSNGNRQQLGKETGQHDLGRTRLLVMTKMEA